jgi:nucleotide-binding universal stress UspA family protein
MYNKTIFVAHDFTLASRNALNIAAEIAVKLNLKLYVYNVVPVTLLNDVDAAFVFNPDKTIAKNQTLMRRMLTSLRKNHNGIKVVFEVDYGLVIPKIQNKIQEINPWIAVLGVKKRNNFDRILFGDVCSDLADLVNIPLLVIPNNFSRLQLNQIVYAWDGQSSDVEYLQVLRKLLSGTPSKIIALNVTHYDEKTQNLLAKFKLNLKRFFYQQKTQVLQEMGLDKNQTIKNALSTIKPNLIVVYAHHYSFFQKLFHASFSKRVIHFSRSPVLIIKEIKE